MKKFGGNIYMNQNLMQSMVFIIIQNQIKYIYVIALKYNYFKIKLEKLSTALKKLFIFY